MSDNFLQFVPIAATWRPTPKEASYAADVLKEMLPLSKKVSISFYDEIQLFHPYGNWEGVRCPRCGTDLEGWWQDAMEAAFEKNYTELTVTTPCCASETSLADLTYPEPLRFGSFVLEAMNPGVQDTSPAQDRRVAVALRTSVAKVRVHL